MLIIGPVIEYTEIEDGIDRRTRWDPQDTLSGMLTIASAPSRSSSWPTCCAAARTSSPSATLTGSPLDYWLELIMFAWYFYFNFSGYSDMAIGSARVFGFRLAPNFNNPYLKTNPQDFWNSWHMSLTRFAQRNVFVPMGGMRARTQYVAIAATMMVIALWHDLSSRW